MSLGVLGGLIMHISFLWLIDMVGQQLVIIIIIVITVPNDIKFGAPSGLII